MKKTEMQLMNYSKNYFWEQFGNNYTFLTKKEDFEFLKTPLYKWLRELDLNQRPSGYEPDELPDCSIPRYLIFNCD